jgi:filamentous hemagglutinin
LISTELGPGTWQEVNESMSDRARAYQERITGIRANVGHVVNGVKFDGYSGGTLIDAKGSGYAKFVDKKTGTFHPWYQGITSIKRGFAQYRKMPIISGYGRYL